MKALQLLLLVACLAAGADAGAQLEIRPMAAGYGLGRTTTFGLTAPPTISKMFITRAYRSGGTTVTAPGFVLATRAFGTKTIGGGNDLLGAPNRTGPLRHPRPDQFDFTRTQPHLAFFCRLEMDETRGGAIPMKFRLGGHRAWQEDLLRR